MQCPKCKKEIDENLLKCPYCGTKAASVCKDCGTVNLINATECKNCHKVLIRICQSCGAANLPEAHTCRKCGFEFIKKKIISKPEYSAQMDSQQKVKARLIDAIKDADSTVITLTGESGIGKNLVIKYVMNEIKSKNIIWMQGSCNQISQLSPFGYFQDLLLAFFNVNNFCPDTLQLKRNSVKFFRQDFQTLSNNEILDLLNFLYPENLDKYENIYKNKTKMFIMMKKVILTIIQKVKTIFVIDNFESIDGMSYDFIKELLKDEYIHERCKFIILSRTIKPGRGFIDAPNLTDENYTDLTIAPFTSMQVEALITQYRDFNPDKDFSQLAARVSCGNPAIVEQMVWLYKDLKRNRLKKGVYSNLESIIDARLGILQNEFKEAYRMLIAMAVLGEKFYPAMLERFDNISAQDFERIMEHLTQYGFINRINNLAYEFKSYDIWKTIVSIVKNDEMFDNILNILFEIISVYKQSSIALLGYIVQKLNNSDKAFDIWTVLMKQAAYIGDIGLYVIAQKQCLKLIEHKSSPFFQMVKKNIYTRVGKLLEPIDYKTSFEYLQNAILMLEDTEEAEHIELLGYIASVAMKTGNYWGVIECADNVLNKIPEENELERALVKSREIKPLVKLGNYGQVISLIDNEIMSVLEKYLTKGKSTLIISIKDLYNLWLDMYFDFAEALTFQGDNRMFDIIKVIFDIVENNKVSEPATLCRVHLALALANTIKGDIQTSEKILDDLIKEYSLDSMNSFIVSRWNFIDILNKFISRDYENLSAELFNVVTYANNINDNFTKNILKTLLAKIFKDKNDNKKALEILEEQVAYFAKEKVATGVLLSWYLIAKIRLQTSGSQFALDIAAKALDIAQGTNINNYYFTALFNKLLGEIYMTKQDYESSKVYIEKSIFIAKKFDLQDLLVKCYIMYARLNQELALPKSTMRAAYIKQALKMFQAAKNVPITSEHLHLQKYIKSELSVLTSFCKVNGIILKKSSN